MKRIMTAFARNSVFANILLVLIFLAGAMASVSMIRENFPEFSLDMITISVTYPGADPEEIEEGISRKIEEAVEGLEGIKLYTTTSAENRATALIEVRENYDVNEVLDRVRNKVDSISTFPIDAEKPIISELTIKDAVMLLNLSGSMPEKLLKEWAESLKDEIQELGQISQVEIFGTREYEIGIEISEERLREYSLTFSEVAGAIRRGNMNLAGGTIRTKGEEIRVRTVGRKYTGKELASIVVKATPDGDVITLDRVATIRDGFTEDPRRAEINGLPAILLIVSKTREEDALAISKAVTKFVKDKQKVLPKGSDLNILYDNTEMLTSRINLLLKNGALGLCFVFVLLWLFLDLRLSFWAGMGIPISLAGALAIIWGMNETINMISLFGFILVLGIVVDDAIVVGESIYVHRRMGKGPLEAAVDGVCEVGMPVVAAIITTVVAFVPLAFVGGIMGKFISILPTVVIACLLISLTECLLLLPAHLSHLPDPNNPVEKNFFLFRWTDRIHLTVRNGLEYTIEKIYKPLLSKALHWRYISFCLAIALLLLTIGFLKGGILKFEVFPQVDGFVMTTNLEFPSGTPVEVTEQGVKQIDNALLRLAEKTRTVSGEPLLEDRLAFIGMNFGEMAGSGPNFGGVQAILLESEKRGIHIKDLMVQWEKEIGAIAGVKSLTIEGMQHGPPGAPIEVWLQGHDMDMILAAADDLTERLGHFDGVYQIRSDFSPGKNELRLELKPEARSLGLTLEDLARQVYAGYFGEEAVRLQRGRDDIRVRVRYSADERTRLSDLERVRIRTPQGHEVPLFSVADMHFSPGYSAITRTDGLRRVAVSADVDTNKANANEIFAELGSGYFQKLERKYPGLRVSPQGEQKKMRESFDSLYVGFPLALLGMFIIIATIFRSYTQPFIIMFTIPFGIIGGIIGHLLFGYDLSIMSVFGMVALAGVVVNDAIVLIERVNENLAEGMRFFDAIINGGGRRFRAIFLTTMSTIGGLAPLIMETDLQARFLIPMALALAAGVAFATLLTLLLIPSFLAIMNDLRLLAYRFRHGAWPKREEVEPARSRYHVPATSQETKPEQAGQMGKPLEHFLAMVLVIAAVLAMTAPIASAAEIYREKAGITAGEASGTTIPDSTTQDSNIPDSNIPNSTTPGSNISDSTTPDSNIPEIEVLDLETAQRIAIRDNPSLAAARERVFQARERITQARAAYWPQLNAMASASRVHQSENAENRAAGISGTSTSSGAAFSNENPEDYYSADLTASWDLFDGFERKFATAAAKYGYRESMAARLDARRLLLSAVASTWHNALLARENIRIAEADANFNQRQMEEARARRRVGTGSLSDVLNFQVQINSARSNLIAAKSTLAETLHGLAALMGISDAVFMPQVKLAPLENETARELNSPDPEALLSHALNHRPDLLQSRFTIKRTQENVGASKAGYYPKIQLSGTLNGDRSNSGRFEEDDFGNTLALNLTYNLFAGGLTRAKVNEARFQRAEAEKTYQNAQITVKAEVHKALAVLDSAREQLILQRSNADLVRQNRNLVEKEYQAGQISLVRLNEAQRDLIEAEGRLARALVSLRQAWQDLKTATAEILIPFGEKKEKP